MSKKGIELKGNMEYQAIVYFLEDILASFKERTICIQKNDDHVTLKPTDSIDFEVEATTKKNKQKLTIELSWTEESVQDTTETFTISCKEPEPAPEAVETEVVVTKPAEAMAKEAVEKTAQQPAKVDDKTSAKNQDNKADEKKPGTTPTKK
ncbi:amphi-Trp domain-containing protein [Desulfovibrio inopinatus]|uniref:amphi-Trp domain-containing protein n=1 Tax=Desulfovibrio inopinatus TaxID=102109 RepID=UPI00040021B3|nr:amphi-Trp domain-containing protein [Desulfovibrio inopinatus]